MRQDVLDIVPYAAQEISLVKSCLHVSLGMRRIHRVSPMTYVHTKCPQQTRTLVRLSSRA